MTELSNTLTNTSAEEDNAGDCSSLLAEYEDRFQHIDSTLEDLRSSFVEVSREDCLAMGNDDDDDDNDASILEEDNAKTGTSASMSTLKATLAEQSAAEMEKIVQTLKEQQKAGSEETATSSSEGGVATGEDSQTISNTPSPSSQPKGWMSAFLLIPVVLAVIWGWKLQPASSPGTAVEITLQQQQQQQQQQPRNILYRNRKVSRTRCRYVNGQQYCESDEQSQSTSSQGDQHYERQQCQYINGESYCESESESFQKNQQQNGNRIAG